MIIDTENIPPDLAGSTIKALCYLRAVGGSSRTSRLAIAAGITTAAITGTIDRAEAAGLVWREQCVADRRVKVIVLTAAGRELVDAMRPTRPNRPRAAAHHEGPAREEVAA